MADRTIQWAPEGTGAISHAVTARFALKWTLRSLKQIADELEVFRRDAAGEPVQDGDEIIYGRLVGRVPQPDRLVLTNA